MNPHIPGITNLLNPSPEPLSSRLHKPEKPVKGLEACSHDELLIQLQKQQKLLLDGTAAKLPDKGEKIKKSIEKIHSLLSSSTTHGLEENFGGLSLKQPAEKKHNKPAEHLSPPVPSSALVDSKSEMPLDPMEILLAPTARPIMQKMFEFTEDPMLNKMRKEHLDLFVRGRRGMKLDTQNNFKGAVALGLDEAINLRDTWRSQKYKGLALERGDDDERSEKYEKSNENEEEGEGVREEEQRMIMDEAVEGEEGREGREEAGEGRGRREVVRLGENGVKERKASVGKIKQQQQQTMWDVQEDMKDILEMIPDEYKQPQKR